MLVQQQLHTIGLEGSRSIGAQHSEWYLQTVRRDLDVADEKRVAQRLSVGEALYPRAWNNAKDIAKPSEI